MRLIPAAVFRVSAPLRSDNPLQNKRMGETPGVFGRVAAAKELVFEIRIYLCISEEEKPLRGRESPRHHQKRGIGIDGAWWGDFTKSWRRSSRRGARKRRARGQTQGARWGCHLTDQPKGGTPTVFAGVRRGTSVPPVGLAWQGSLAQEVSWSLFLATDTVSHSTKYKRTVLTVNKRSNMLRPDIGAELHSWWVREGRPHWPFPQQGGRGRKVPAVE